MEMRYNMKDRWFVAGPFLCRITRGSFAGFFGWKVGGWHPILNLYTERGDTPYSSTYWNNVCYTLVETQIEIELQFSIGICINLCAIIKWKEEVTKQKRTGTKCIGPRQYNRLGNEFLRLLIASFVIRDFLISAYIKIICKCWGLTES